MVTFNEIMYYPPGNNRSLEWVELHNQLAVDQDLSDWSLGGGIEFRFPRGTVLPAWGYLVVSADPAALRALTGLDQVFGPFVGTLANEGERLILRNLNNRIMDEVTYNNRPRWPLGAAGSGASLAKRLDDSPSDPASHWRASREPGGTPGRPNFPELNGPEAPIVDTLLASHAPARWHIPTEADAALAWITPDFLDTSWSVGTNGFGFDRADAPPMTPAARFYPLEDSLQDAAGGGRHGTAQGNPVFTTGTPSAAQNSLKSLHLDGIDDAVICPEPVVPVAYTLSLWVRFEVLRPCSLLVLTDGAGPAWNWSHQLRLNANNRFEHYTFDGGGHVVVSSTVAQEHRWYHVAATAENGGVIRLFVDGTAEGTPDPVGTMWPSGDRWVLGSNSGESPFYLQGSLDEVAIWHQALPSDQIAFLATGGSPLSGGGLKGLFATDLAAPMWKVNASAWLRFPFQTPTGSRFDQLLLNIRYNDGFVAWLNGTEVARRNAPSNPAWNSAATASRTAGQSAIAETIDLTQHLALLRPGVNSLAVQGLNAGPDQSDFLIQPELTARRAAVSSAAPTIIFSEAPAAGTLPFWCELFNASEAPVALDTFRLLHPSGANWPLPAATLNPGAFLVVSPPAFPLQPSDVLFLTTRDGVLVDSLPLDSQARARRELQPEADWLCPLALTPGVSNAIALHDEIIISEILYHAPPTYRRPGTPPGTKEHKVVSWDATWRYNQSGQDLGTAWREPSYDDANWPKGPGILGFRTGALSEPIRTPLTLGSWTYYFRLPFVLDAPSNPCPLQLRVLVDDGAVFYLNGKEIFRQKMPDGEVTFSTPAVNVGDPFVTGPHLLTATNIVPGTNWLAVEVHQWNIASSDVVGGAELAVSEIVTPGTPDIPFAENDEQWIELYNRSDHPVTLDGWRLSEAVSFRFPPGTRMEPGSYLVIAHAAASLRLRYPQARILGDFSGNFSHRGDHVLLLDDLGNPVEEVRYGDDRPWPANADGRGSSLERIDPRADPGSPNSWAASRESGGAPWKHYAFTIRAAEPVFGPPLNGFSELRLGLLDDGECLMDNLQVVEDPQGNRRSLLQNGDFSLGTQAWRFLGNHSHSRVENDPANAANSVLHLVATDARGYLHNQIETTLKSGGAVIPVVAGQEYEIAFDAQWLAGSPQLHTELYYNRVARTTILDQPDHFGTPGAPNSTRLANLGPTCHNLQHDPPVPKPSEPITISVTVQDPDGVAAVVVHYSVNEGPWQTASMTTPDPAASRGPAGAHYSVTLADQPAQGSVIQFYISASDMAGATSLTPAAGPDSRALIRVDNRSAGLRRRPFHLILTPRDGAVLDAFQNMMSDDRLGATVVWNDREIYYDCGVHLHGSMFSRNNPDAATYNIQFPADHRFRGIHRTVQVKRRIVQEIIAKHVQNQAGVPGMYEDIVHLFSHRPAHAGPARLSLAHYNDVYLDSQFEHGADGLLYNMEGIRVAMATHDGTPEGIKLPFPIDWVGNYDITDLGGDPEQYRWTTMLRNNRARDEFGPYIALAKAFNQTGASLQQAVPAVMDPEEWMRVFALLSLFGIGDTYTQGNPHNLNLYARPSDHKILALPYDWDFFFALDPSAPLWGDQNLSRIIALPIYTRLFHGQLLDLIETWFSTDYLTPWVSHFSAVASEDYSYVLDRVRARSAFVRTQLPARIPFEITSNGGADFAVSTPTVQLEGRGWIDVAAVRWLDRSETFPLTWLDSSTWQLTLPLPASSNRIVLEARNRRGEPVGQDAITITTTGADDSQRSFLRIGEIMYHPAAPTPAESAAGFTDGDAFEFIELVNLGPGTVSLQGVRFDRGITFDFSGSSISNLASAGRVLVVRDRPAFQARYGADLPVAGVYEGGLDNSGETLRLIDRWGLVIQEFAYDDNAGWPTAADGTGPSLEAIDFRSDPGSPLHWRASAAPRGSPGFSGAGTPSLSVGLTEDHQPVLHFVLQAGQACRIEATENLIEPNWGTLLTVPVPWSNGAVDLVLPMPSDSTTRFFRVASP